MTHAFKAHREVVALPAEKEAGAATAANGDKTGVATSTRFQRGTVETETIAKKKAQ